MNKSNVTLWKSKYVQQHQEEDNKIETDYIENLKKQVYFMEMELKLLKDREREIEKSGGFNQLFNDERDVSQHLTQLKQKYANMRKIMESKVEDLSNKRREVLGSNVALQAKLEALQQIERDTYQKLMTIEETSAHKITALENEFLIKNRERLEIEANSRLAEIALNNEILQNEELEFAVLKEKKLEELKTEHFDKSIKELEDMIERKKKEYEYTHSKIKESESKLSDDVVFKSEYEKNLQNKKKIEGLEKECIELNIKVQQLEVSNDYLIRRKDDVLAERKKLNTLNEELKREIEAKNQLNELRIQKKVRDSNSEDIQKTETHLKNIINKISDLESRVSSEMEKSRNFLLEIIKLNIQIKQKELKKDALVNSVDLKLKELTLLKEKLESLKIEYYDLNDKVILLFFNN